jgi:hypothetical protein
MTGEDLFRRIAERNVPGYPEWVLRAAAAGVARGESRDVPRVMERKALQLASVIAEVAPPPAPEQAQLLGPTPTLELLRDALLAEAEESVIEARHRLFGGERPNFAPDDWSQAKGWLREEFPPPFGPDPRDELRALGEDECARKEEHREEIRDRLTELADEASDLWGVPVAAAPVPVFSLRCDDDLTIQIRGKPASVQLYVGAPVAIGEAYHKNGWLFTVVPDLARFLGIAEGPVVQWIMCGTPPVIPRATVSAHRITRGGKQQQGGEIRGGVWRDWIEITLNTPDVDFDTLRQVHSFVRQLWAQANVAETRETVTEADLQLHRLVRDLGGHTRERQPHGFWQTAARRWSEETGMNASEAALRQAWRRLRRKRGILPTNADQGGDNA